MSASLTASSMMLFEATIGAVAVAGAVVVAGAGAGAGADVVATKMSSVGAAAGAVPCAAAGASWNRALEDVPVWVKTACDGSGG